MNFKFIAKIAKKNPALARLIEASLAAGLSYVAGAVVEGKVFSLNALVVAIFTPTYLALSKYNRDLN